MKGVVSMNEDYELKWLANAKQVSVCTGRVILSGLNLGLECK